MRRTLVLALAAFALLGVVTPDAWAQAPTPTFKINGFVDTLTTYARNVSLIDGDLHRIDTQWYGRSRGRFDIIGEVGKAKAVLGLEIDGVFGQTGSADSNIPTTTVQTHFGASGGYDINTDLRAIIEVKWLYVEFPVPLIPVPTVARLGAQAFGSAATYKLAAYANGDFPGVNLTSTITPNVKLQLTYVALEEALEGRQQGFGVPAGQHRGDDLGFIVSPEVTVMKGLDVKPMYAYLTISGTTSTSTRQGRGGINTSTAFTDAAGNWIKGMNEDRHTVGVDARFRSGPFSFDPTILYQFGNREVIAPASFAAVAVPGRKYHADIDAWLLDLRAGYQIGPLLVQGMYMYTTGNRARNTTLGTVRSFQPLSTDTSYSADWGGQLMMLGLDYFSALRESGLSAPYTGVSIGYDKYGRHQISPKVTYALTPDLSASGGVILHLTDTAVQKNATPTAGAGITPVFVGPQASQDLSNYLGTELFGQIGWRFAPGISWDNGAGYMFMGGAHDAITNAATGPRDAKDAYILTSRIRFTF